MAGSAMLAIAVSSDATATAVKIAATAQRLRSMGRPSCGGGLFAALVSTDIAGNAPDRATRPFRLRRCRKDVCSTDSQSNMANTSAHPRLRAQGSHDGASLIFSFEIGHDGRVPERPTSRGN